MPDCPEVFALLSDYLDGELPPDEMKRLESHIGGCSPCVTFVDSLRKRSRRQAPSRMS